MWELVKKREGPGPGWSRIAVLTKFYKIFYIAGRRLEKTMAEQEPDVPTPSPANPVSPAPEIPPVSPGPETSGLAPNIAAGLACLFSIVGGIIFLLIEKKNAFVRFYAMQSIFLSVAVMAVGLVFRILVIVFVHIPILGFLIIRLGLLVYALAGLAFFVAWMITIIKAFSNVEWEVPIIGKLARQQLAKSPL